MNFVLKSFRDLLAVIGAGTVGFGMAFYFGTAYGSCSSFLGSVWCIFKLIK